MGGVYSDFAKGDVTPQWREDPKFDPMYGFANGRKERVMLASNAEMEAAHIEPRYRDYCAHHLIKYYQCRRDNFPWVVSCKHERHHWDECQYKDWILRMKEYERERRLLERTKRKAARAPSEELGD